MKTALVSDREAISTATTQDILIKLLNSTREAVIVVDGSLRVSAANDSAYESLGRSSGKLEGRRLSEVVRDTALHDGFRWSVERREPSELRLELSGNEVRIFDVHIAPLEIDGAQLAVGFFYNVSRIERLERIRQEFLSNISHELRTPLTSILAFVETLEDGGLEDEENNRHFLSVIRRNGERMRNLIADILELSQIEAGNVSLAKQDVKLSTLVAEIATSLSSMAAAREITLNNEVAPETTVNAD